MGLPHGIGGAGSLCWASSGLPRFTKTQEELDALLNRQSAKLEKAGVPPRTALAYQALGPLLMEREAIGRFLMTPANYSLRGAIPELTSPEEAVEIADLDLRLDPPEKTLLQAMLTELM